MMKCWEAAPDDRPCFKELRNDTSNYAEHIAGYLELGFNPFAGAEGALQEDKQKDEENGFECAVSIQVIPPSLDTSMGNSVLNSTTD